MRSRAVNRDFSWTLVRDTDVDMVVTFSGYYDPGKTYGRPEDCYPAEGEVTFHTVALEGHEPIDFDDWAGAINLTDDERAKMEEQAFETMTSHEDDE